MDILQILDYGIREYGAAIALALILIGSLVLNTKLTKRGLDAWWYSHVHEFATDKAQKMIAGRDQEIRILKSQISELNRERRSLIDAVRAAALFADRTREILTQPEIIRLRGMTDVEPGYSLKKRG